MALKAAPEDQALLLELQAVDTRVQQLAHRGSRLAEDEALSALIVERDDLQRTLAEQTGACEDAKLELSRVESDVATVEARIGRDRDRLQTTSSVKDVQAFEQELAALATRKSNLEDIQLAVMETVELRESELSTTHAAAGALEDRIADTTTARDAARAALDEEQRQAAGERDALAARVPSELLALYEKQRARYGSGASHLQRGMSSASGVALNATDLDRVRAASPDDVLLCPDSNAVLVRTPESGL